MSELVEQILRRWAACKSERDLLSPIWDRIADVLQPSTSGFQGERAIGDSRQQRIFDGHAIVASNRCATAIESELVPADVKWLAIGTVDELEAEDDDAMEWLDEVSRVEFDRIYDAESGFQAATAQVFANLVAFGAGACHVGQSKDLSGFVFRTVHLRDIWWRRDANGLPQTVYVRSMLRVQEAVERFGEASLSPDTQKLAADKDAQDRKVEIIEAVMPRDRRIVGSPHVKDMPWAVFTMETAAKHLIAEGGETSMPWVIPEWQVLANGDIWSLGRQALPDVEQLQAMAKTMVEAGQMAVRPPLAMPGGILDNKAQLVPGGITLYNPTSAGRYGQGGLIQQLGMVGSVPIGMEMLQALYDRIDRVFLLDVLQLPDKHGMTATEVLRLNADLVRLTSSPFGRFETNFVRPLVERCFNTLLQNSIELRFGQGSPLKPPPASLQGQKIKFKFTSPASRARRQADTAQLATFIESLAPLIQVRPEMLDNIDVDEVTRDYTSQSMSPKYLVPKDKRDALRKAKMDLAQQQNQMDQIEQGATAAGKAAPFLQTIAGQTGEARRIGAAA